MKTIKTVLGVDPGFSFTGFGLLRTDEQGKTALIDCGYLKLPTQRHLAERIELFYRCFTEKIKMHEVSAIALETPFLGKNTQSFLKLGYLRGVLYLLAAQHQLPLYEFAPREVKLAVTGFGGATKDQVATMMFKLFGQLAKLPETVRRDVTDAIAITVCGHWKMSTQPDVAGR